MAAAALGVVVLAGAAAFTGIYQPPFAYELLAANTHGAYGVTARLPAGIKPPEETFVAVELFREVEEELESVPEARLTMRYDSERSTGQQMVLASPTLYLPKGHYRLKVALENTLTWDAFYLAPRQEQRRAGATRARHESLVLLRPPAAALLAIRHRVESTTDGSDITVGTAVALRSSGRWLPWTPILSAGLTNNALHRFRFTRDGYFPRIYSVRVDAYQSHLQINAAVAPPDRWTPTMA
jgi:hypothetical protein